MSSRNCFLLTCNSQSKRTEFSKSILNNIGFNVNLVNCIPNNNTVLSNKLSMIYIYELIANGNDEWCYVFEDDINILEDIKLYEIIEYEKISTIFFYLGLCVPKEQNRLINSKKVNNKEVSIINGNVRGLHAIGISKLGAKNLLSFIKKMNNYLYMDMILEMFSKIYPANCIRYDLESYIKGHRGIFFQDRNKFPSTIL